MRFRTLGCYPVTGAVESRAATIDDLIREMAHSGQSKRAGHLVDGDRLDSKGSKKRSGYL